MKIHEHLQEGLPLLLDGAMGTVFAALPRQSEAACESANLDCPEQIVSIHKAYLAAGSNAIQTNTFSLSAAICQGRAEEAQRLLVAGCQLAQQAVSGTEAAIFADIGPAPLGMPITPAKAFIQQMDWFLQQGLSCFLLETLPSDEGIREAAEHLKQQCPEAFLLVSYAVRPEGFTREGLSCKGLLERTAALPQVDAVGINCVSGPHHMLSLLKGVNLSGKYLSVMPNAGYPTVVGRRTVYQGTPEYFSERMMQLRAVGASILGGCCGTTPDHIAALAKALQDAPALSVGIIAGGETEIKPDNDPNPIWDKLAAGQRIIAVELDPPADDRIAPFLSDVQTLMDAHVDAITIADCPIARPRADSSLLACKLKREQGMAVLPHMTCRDRNLNATKALLLGLAMEGVRNVLIVTGDPVPTEERTSVKSVFNFNSRKLAAYITELNSQLAHPFRIFAALNLNAVNFRVQLDLAKEKEACGVSGFLTQPVLSKEALENLKLARQELQGKILGGVFPIVSYRNACFLNNEIAGMRVSPDIAERYKGLERDEAEKLAAEISVHIAKEIEPYTDGWYLMTPFRRVGLIREIVKGLKG